MFRLQSLSLPVIVAVLCANSPSSAQRAQEILDTFVIHPEFQLELVAMEPVVYDPVDLEFDERGRPFVVEMPGYPFPEEDGHVVLLGDEDGDGVYESRKEFAGGFPTADSLTPYNGGFLVASPPDLIFIKDTDGDDVADYREVLVTGFAVGNPQHNFNGIQTGLDNWIYGANGDNGGSIYWAGDKEGRVSISRSDFRLDIRSRRIEPFGRTPGGFGITFDDWGHHFGTHNLVHISHIVFPGKYLDALPIRGESSLDETVSDHNEGETARIFPIGIQETRVNHPEQSGYFSGSCGIHFYGGGAFPPGFENSVFVCDVVTNLVHHDVISANGATLKASRARDRVEFLASRDRAFRPVNLSVGPDGALYVVDMHREVIEHPEWIPQEFQEKMDLNAGKQQGRIFRITPKGGVPERQPAFNRSAVAATVAALADGNKWWRDTAQRLLVEWREPSAVPLVQNLFDRSENPLARLHAMWTLEGLTRLDESRLLAALADEHEGVRENAVIIARERMNASSAVRYAVSRAARDAAPRVRMQAALALGTLDPTPVEELLQIAEHDIDDHWTRLAVYAGLGHAPRESLAALTSMKDLLAKSSAQSLAHDLAELTAFSGDGDAIAAVTANAAAGALPVAARVALLEGLVAGIESNRAEISTNSTIDLAPLFASDSPRLQLASGKVARALGQKLSGPVMDAVVRAGEIARDASQPKEMRLDNLALYELAPYETRADTLFALLDKDHPAEIQRAAIEQLQRVRKPAVAKRLIENWDTLGRQTLTTASNILLYQRENHPLLLDAVEQGIVPLGQLNLHLERRRVLLRSRDENVRKRAEALFTDAGVVTRREAIERMRPALDLKGDPTKGKAVFEELCNKCHEISGEGFDLGPSLTDIYRKSPETLLHDILDPNAGVEPEYVSYAIESKSGEFFSGVVANETDDAVTLRAALGETKTFARSDIKEMYSGGLSLMPEELEAGMEPQTFANLLAYLLEPR